MLSPVITETAVGFSGSGHPQPRQHDGKDDPQGLLRQVIGRNSPQEGPEDDPGGQARQDPGDHVPMAPVGVGTDGCRRNHAQQRASLCGVLVHPDKEDHPCNQEGPAADSQQPRDETRCEAGDRKGGNRGPARQGRYGQCPQVGLCDEKGGSGKQDAAEVSFQLPFGKTRAVSGARPGP